MDLSQDLPTAIEGGPALAQEKLSQRDFSLPSLGENGHSGIQSQEWQGYIRRRLARNKIAGNGGNVSDLGRPNGPGSLRQQPGLLSNQRG
jgi:hypothetical protein